MAPVSVSSDDIESSWPVKTPYMTAEVLQVRIGKVKPCFATAEPTGIFKIPQDKPVKVGVLGCEGDERSFPPHTGPDNALMQYAYKHYKLWQAEYPEKAHLFQKGGFGENLVTEEVDENTLCIGDILSLGDEVQVEVTKPRQPCYKLNQRFEIKNMSWLSQKTGRTGWYYRILRGGYIKSGDKLTLLERKNPKWTIAKIQHHLYEDPYRKDEAAMKEIAQLPGLGDEIRLIFQNRLKKVFKDDRERLQGTSEKAPAWSLYTLVERQKETPRITSFVFEAHQPTEGPEKVVPGSHIRVKLGEKENILRSYSIVQGDSHRFKISVSLDPSTSKGGSQHLHEKVKIGGRLVFGPIKCDFPLRSIQNNASSRDKVEKEPQHVFIAGGVGITAFMASMEYLNNNSKDGQDWHLYYAVRSKAEVAFKKELSSYGNKVTILDGSEGQRIDLVGIIKKARLSNSPIYVCGPTRLRDAVISTANTLHFPTSMLHFEAFDADITGDPFTVEVLKPKKILEVGADQSLMDVLREAGLDIASSCEVGNCGTCKVNVKEGKVEHRGTRLSDSDKKGSMLSCVSRGIGRIVLDLEGCDVTVK